MARYVTLLQRLIEAVGLEATFNALLEAVFHGLSLHDWETNPRWGTDETGKHVGASKFVLAASDFVATSAPGHSISKSDYLFLPTGLVISNSDGVRLLKHIAYLIKNDGKVVFDVYPGFGLETDIHKGAMPAIIYKHMTHEEQQLVDDQVGRGKIIFAMNGEPLSYWLGIDPPKTISDGDTPLDVFVANATKSDESREWLSDFIKIVEKATDDGKVTQNVSKVRGFEYNLVLSSKGGDSVLVISHNIAKAAYIFKKQMWIESDQGPVSSDWDVVVDTKMREFIARYRRRPRGTKGEDIPAPNLTDAVQPRLALRYWMEETERRWGVQQGFALRRDYHLKNIADLIDSGINYSTAEMLADRIRTK
ncbi:MAG: hypothetical protein QXU32_00820 [Nitrososphaerales archaeon]